MIQFQGMIAEYERAQIAERTRRGKVHRARAGTVNVLGGAPFGYRYIRRSDEAEARYEIVEEEAAVVREMFRRYVEDNLSIAGSHTMARRTRASPPRPARPAGIAPRSGACCATRPMRDGPRT